MTRSFSLYRRLTYIHRSAGVSLYLQTDAPGILLELSFLTSTLGIGFLRHRRLFVSIQESSETNIPFDSRLECLIGLCESSISEQLIHLFQSESLGLGKQEVYPECSDYGYTAEEDEGSKLGRRDEGRGGDADGEVVQPVGTAAERYALGAHAEGKDFRNDDPRYRTPTGGFVSSAEHISTFF